MASRDHSFLTDACARPSRQLSQRVPLGFAAFSLERSAPLPSFQARLVHLLAYFVVERRARWKSAWAPSPPPETREKGQGRGQETEFPPLTPGWAASGCDHRVRIPEGALVGTERQHGSR